MTFKPLGTALVLWSLALSIPCQAQSVKDAGRLEYEAHCAV